MEWRWNGDGLEMELGVELELGNFSLIFKNFVPKHISIFSLVL